MKQNHRPLHCPAALTATLALGLLGATHATWAQPQVDASATPAQRYEQRLARCNSGQLPEPERDACVRDAGRELDQAQGHLPGNLTRTTPDGRATVVSPAGLPPPDSGSGQMTSPDGRATVVVPADRSAPTPR